MCFMSMKLSTKIVIQECVCVFVCTTPLHKNDYMQSLQHKNMFKNEHCLVLESGSPLC